MISTQDIKNKEVINIFDGKSMGYVSDLEVNLEKGVIEAIIVPEERGFFGFFSRDNEHVIKWKDIKRIGDDVILVEVPFDFSYRHEDFDQDEEKNSVDYLSQYHS